jgi:hypothetical protein
MNNKSAGHHPKVDYQKRSNTRDSSAHAAAPAPDYGQQDQTGVDLSLLRQLLRLSPLERLQRAEEHARDMLILYEYGKRHREAKAGSDR